VRCGAVPVCGVGQHRRVKDKWNKRILSRDMRLIVVIVDQGKNEDAA
jgi:hypothetical protein